MKNLLLFKGWLLLYCILLLALPCPAFATRHPAFYQQQQTTITGTVTVDGMPMTGVTIAVAGTTTTAISGEDGHYTINANASDTLVFSYIGFTTVSEPVNGRNIINVNLKEDATTLQEVTVNAGYYSVKEKERTGSIAKVKAADIEKQPVSNPLAAMQGRMAGVNITQQTGTPGGGFTIQIRGINSIRGEANEPLYIVNGVPFASQTLGNSNISSSSRAGSLSPLGSINPADIESIEVLKDADATAIYGSRGANGVVLITTKKGKQGKTSYGLQAYTSFGTVTRKMDLMNTPQYLAMRREAFANEGITEIPATAYDLNGTWDENRYTDWQEQLIGGTANINHMQLSASGGNANTQYLLSGTYRDETTVYPGDSNYAKGTVHSSLSHHSADDKFGLTLSADYTSDKNTMPGIDLTRVALTTAPNAPGLYDAEGNINWENGTFENPLGYLNGTYVARSNQLLANALLSYTFSDNLEFRTSLGYNDYRVGETRTSPTTMYNPINGIGAEGAMLDLNNATRSSWIVEPQLQWRQQWNSFDMDVLAGATFQDQQAQSLALNGTGFASNALINSIAAATTLRILGDDQTQYRYNSVFGRLNLKFKDRYIVNLTGRRDGSSRFGPGNRFANFGAVGVAWIFSEEPLLKKGNSIFSFGKLRGSYGSTGSDQIGDYQYLDTYAVSGNMYNGSSGLMPTRLYNPAFGWETSHKLEAALELGFLKDRIFMTAAWFRNSSSNQLVGVPLPGTTGFSSLQANLDATVRNTGFEAELRTVNVQGKDFNWTMTFNLTAAKNKLVSFPGLEGSTYASSLVIGEPLSIKQLYHFTGIDPETGTYAFEDYNGDGQITPEEDRKVLKDTSPEFYGGFGNQVSYKNWNLDLLFQFVKQEGRNYLYSANLAGTFANQPAGVLNHWPQDGTIAEIQQYTTGENYTAIAAYLNYSESDATVSDASYVRLKSMSLSYALPKSLSKTVTGKIYLQGQNLLTFTHFKGADPENQSTYFLPPLRQVTLGVQLAF